MAAHGIQVIEREKAEKPPSPTASPEPQPSPRTKVEPTRVRVPLLGLGTIGLFTLLLGAWGGIVPFVGPTFGYSADGTGSWYWNLMHALLWLVPGSAAVVAGATMMGALPRAFRGRGHVAGVVSGFFAMLCGAWFVVGPVAWPTLIENSSGVFVPTGPMHELSNQIGYSLGPGLLLVALGSICIGLCSPKVSVPVLRRGPLHEPAAAAPKSTSAASS